jgi:uncharacterized protein
MPNEGLVLDNPVLRIEKGRTAPPSEDEPEPRGSHDEHIPWGYGHDRLTAMAVDPNRLYLYWELTDPAIDKARQALGAGAKDAWVNLRIYDVTDRIFDGTNAHSYFDIKVDRSDRQWFVHVGKPASTHVAEIGLKSLEGYFVKVARSGRVDFPRFEPSPDGTVEWLTVRTATGPVDPAAPGQGPGGSSGDTPGSLPGGDFASHGGTTQNGGAIELVEWSWTGWEDLFQTTWQELFRTRWHDGHPSLDWSTPVLRSSWEAGPFTVPVEAPRVTEEYYQGPMTVMPAPGNKTRIVYGPWQVIVRGIGGHAEKRLLARWEVAASWVVEMGIERVVSKLSPGHHEGGVARETAHGGAFLPGGSSELLGASERRWLAASELRLRGASEVFFAGASELRWRGASEVLFGAASEVRWRGASEIRLASEGRLLGASERLFLGASEGAWLGASEGRLGGARESVDPFAIDRDVAKLGGG